MHRNIYAYKRAHHHRSDQMKILNDKQAQNTT